MRLRSLPLSLLLCLFVAAAAVPAGAPATAEAHTIKCADKRAKAKHGTGVRGKKAKRACLRRQSKHRNVHKRLRASRAKAKLKRPSAPATSPAPTDSTVGAVSPPEAGSGTAPYVTAPITDVITGWRAAGSVLSDADAAARVRRTPETRPGNMIQNAYRPTASELDTFRNGQVDKYGRTALKYNRLTAHVTGGFSGTTDEILQWVAHKWGIPENIVRSVAVNESWWNMSQLGDRRTITDPLSYPAQSRIAGTSDVYQSLGIMQIKWTPQGLHPGTEPLRWKSTAFNADYWASVVRYYYDGLCDWCGSSYGPGQEWNSVGAWYNPSPWITGSQTYQDNVKRRLAGQVWAQAGF